jgi:ABC-type lipoprotein release transport system permease subunit
VRVLRAMGLTPVQVRAAVVVRTSVLALVAVTLGSAAGLAACSALISTVSRLYGLGSGLARLPSAVTVLAAITAVVAAAALTGLSTTRAADRDPAVVVLGP